MLIVSSDGIRGIGGVRRVREVGFLRRKSRK